MKKRTDLLNLLAERYGLKRYLEIGLQDRTQNFDKIICEYKLSIDPDPNSHASFCMTSDEFFNLGTNQLYIDDETKTTFDLIFIDGLHHADQVKKDFRNALKILSPNGFIVLHDCNPEKEEHTIVPRPTERGHWNGDVYRFALFLTYPHDGFNRPYVVDIDNGCLVFSRAEHDVLNLLGLAVPAWDGFNEHRKEILNLKSWDEFTSMLPASPHVQSV